MVKQVLLTIQQEDVMSYEADVLALKYAGTFFGADRAVAERLVQTGKAKDVNELRVRSTVTIVESQGAIAARQVMFVYAPRPREFSYDSVRKLAVNTLYQLKYSKSITPNPRSMVTTIHGSGFGLDELEIITSQVAGYLEAFRNSEFPESLETIVIVDLDPRRVERLRGAVDALLAQEPSATAVNGETWGYAINVDALRGISPGSSAPVENGSKRSRAITIESTPAAPTATEREAERSEAKKHIFVAIPFRPETEDLWEFGIYMPIRDLDLRCSRIDHEAFSGDIFDQIKFRIETAAAIVAVLDGYNPNVFLELGYAMGKGIPSILLAQKSMIDEKKLPFDIQSQRCIGYTNIKDCKKLLTTELTRFQKDGVI
ncbi:MAG: hypothetical protein U0670_04855 [Anaerolineae bacterium]